MISPYYSRNGLVIYKGDCRDILPQLPAESIGLTLTSPPYNCGLKYSGYEDDLPNEAFRELNRAWLAEVFRCSKETARLYAVVSDKMLWWMRPLGEEAGWTWGQLLVWCKPNFSGGTTRVSGDWNMMTEWVLLYRKGKRVPMLASGETTHNYVVIPSPQTNWKKERKEHIAQWPSKLPLHLLARTPGDVVLDPFMGSGATLLAAGELGRQAIGIEVSEADCALAVTRLDRFIDENKEGAA